MNERQLPNPIRHILNEIESLFIHEMAMALPPWEFKTLTIPLCDGKTDLAEHISHYQSWMIIVQAYPETMCNAFSLTFKGIIQTWFGKLQPRSIHLFEQLHEEFTT